jgi:hypothetical protein
MKIILFILCLLPVSSFGSDSLQTFTSACPLKAPAEYCQALEKNVFKNTLPVQEFLTREFMVPDFPTDSTTLFLIIYSAKHTAALGYCYFVAKELIDQNKVKPTGFAKGVNGFAILSSEISAYEIWLKTDNGMKCRQNVENSVGLPVIDLKDRLKNKLGMVVLNPLSLAQPNVDLKSAMNEMKVILNHERIHILQTACPAIDDFAKESWAKLDPMKKADLKKDIPEYNWNNHRVAVREFLAFTYEKDPSPLLAKAKGCKF